MSIVSVYLARFVNSFIGNKSQMFFICMCVCLLCCFSGFQLFATLYTIACQAPLSMGLPSQEYWGGLPCPPPGNFPLSSIQPCIDRRVLYHWHHLESPSKQYKKAHLCITLSANPFGGASHAKGIVLEKVGVEAKQPNSAIRKCVRVQLIKNGKKKNHCFCTQ